MRGANASQWPSCHQFIDRFDWDCNCDKNGMEIGMELGIGIGIT